MSARPAKARIVSPMATLRICIDVPDLERAIEFYTGIFGWTPRRRRDFVELAGAPVPIDLLPRPTGMRNSPPNDSVRAYERHWTPIHLDIVVDDVDVIVARALTLGARVEAGPIDQPFGRIAQIADPFGHGFCVLQMSERGYDANEREPST